MPIYDITQIPVRVSDEKVRELVASLGLTLTAAPEISGVGITVGVQEELSPAQLAAAQDAIRSAVLAHIGVIEKRS